VCHRRRSGPWTGGRRSGNGALPMTCAVHNDGEKDAGHHSHGAEVSPVIRCGSGMLTVPAVADP
jgi:hypothetical protein